MAGSQNGLIYSKFGKLCLALQDMADSQNAALWVLTGNESLALQEMAGSQDNAALGLRLVSAGLEIAPSICRLSFLTAPDLPSKGSDLVRSTIDPLPVVSPDHSCSGHKLWSHRFRHG